MTGNGIENYDIPVLSLHLKMEIPFMARDKPDGGTRVIVDLSWPLVASVNSCILSDIYNILFKLKYPAIDHVVEQIKVVGPEVQLYKIDFECTFAISE